MEKMRKQKPLALHPNGSRAVKIGDCVIGYVTGKPRNQRTWALAGQRLAEIEEILRSRHGAFVSGDDASSYVEPLAAAVANARRAAIRKEGREASSVELVEAVIAACRRWLPGLPTNEIEEAALDAVDTPRFEKADEIGKLLGVSFVERQALGLKTIGCRDLSKRQRTAAVKAGKIERQKARRRTAGMKPREEYESNSVRAIAASWGVSRQTVYDWRKRGDPRGFDRFEAHIVSPILASHMSTGQQEAQAERPQGAERPKRAGSLPGLRPVAPRSDREKKKPEHRSATTLQLKKYNIDGTLLIRLAAIAEAGKSAPEKIRTLTAEAARAALAIRDGTPWGGIREFDPRRISR